MGDVIMWPMHFAIYERKDQSAFIVWAKRTNRIISVTGLPDSWLYTDSGLARMRLIHTGWTEINTGKVENNEL